MINKCIKGENVKDLAGGSGDAVMSKLFQGDDLPAKAGLMAVIDLMPGSEVGYHQHVGDNELYWIIEGEGEYTENGETTLVKGGMATLVHEGGWHGLKNTGSEPLKMFAVIIKD